MLEICNSFAAEHNLIFNTKKSLGIKYGGPVCASDTIYLGGNKIRWESIVCHLGNYLDTKLSDMIDCKMICSRFIGSVKRVMVNFGHLQSHIFSQFFKKHCCTFYGFALWYFNSEDFAKICTTVCFQDGGQSKCFDFGCTIFVFFHGYKLQILSNTSFSKRQSSLAQQESTCGPCTF